MLKRLFPTIAQLTSDWPPEKWIMAPVAVVVGIIMVAAVIRAVDPAIAHLVKG
jgi:hypothetical protein